VHLEDLLATADIRQADHHLAVETSRAQQRRVEHVRAVGRGDDDHAVVAFEAVHLDQELVEGLLALVVAAAKAGAAMPADGIDLVDEDDAGCCFFAWSNMSRTREAPTPTNISTKSEPEMEKNGTFASPAIAARAGSCPYRAARPSARRAGSPPSFWNLLGSAELDQLLHVFLGFVDTRHVGEGR
jgi:hypothetical protein